MNMDKFIPKIALAITLVSLSPSTQGFEKILGYVIAGVIALAAIVLLFENKSSKPIWKSIVHWAESLNMTYVAFGLGLMLVSSKFSNITWARLLLLVSGVVFAGAGIGKLIGKSGSELVKLDAKIAGIIGFIFIIAGVVVGVLTWNSIIDKPLLNAPYPILLVFVGIIFIYFGCRKLLKLAYPKHEK